jgi:AAA domain
MISQPSTEVNVAEQAASVQKDPILEIVKQLQIDVSQTGEPNSYGEWDDTDSSTGRVDKVVWQGNEYIDGVWIALTPLVRLSKAREQEGSNEFISRYRGACPFGCKGRDNRTMHIETFSGVRASVRAWCSSCKASGKRLAHDVLKGYTKQAEKPVEDNKPIELDFNTDTDGKRTYRTYTLDDIETFSDIKWLVQNVLQCSTTSLLYGDSNTGKTFIGLDIALRVATGMTWQGRKVQAGRVLYIYAEGKLGLKPRWQAWKKHFNGTATDNISFIPCPVHLIGNRDELTRTVESLPDKPVLVIVDTFSMCAPDTNENAANEVSRVLEVANYIKRTYV